MLICIGPIGLFGEEALPPVLSNPSACNLWLHINDVNCDNPNQFEINVNSAPGTAMGVDVSLKEVRFFMTHQWLADVEVRLYSPSGQMTTLIDEVGGGNKNFGDPTVPNCGSYTTLVAHTNDINCDFVSIDEASHPFLGSYLPVGNFSSFNDGISPIGNWMLEICDDNAVDTGSLQFIELVFEPSSCLQPSDVQLVSVDSNTVVLDWVPGANDCSNTIIELGQPGFTPGTNGVGTGSIELTGCPPDTITGLDPSTAYEVYVRQNCGGGNYSQNSCPLVFSTMCSPPPATLTEGFDGQQLCEQFCGVTCDISGIWHNSKIDDFDWLVHRDSTSTGKTGPLSDVSGDGQYIYLESSNTNCQQGRFAHLVSTCIDVVARPDTCDMSFYFSMYGANVESLKLQATVDGGDNWLTLWQMSGDQGEGWHRGYVDLDAIDGQTAQFQFIGEGGNGKNGDIALDEIVFHGSTVSSTPTFLYFEDGDGDGYGGQSVFYQTCFPYQLPGFVPDSTDCNDMFEFVNPGMEEIPCDNFDLNCNGMVDETDLPPLQVTSDTVCSGSIGVVSASPTQFGSEISWYASQNDTLPLATGTTFSPPNFPANLTDSPVTLTYFAEETSDSCRSVVRSQASIVILPQPEISTSDSPEICAGTEYDLTTIDVIDANGANGIISYHSDFPVTPGNEIAPMVTPASTDIFYIASTPDGGCTDVVSVVFSILPTPTAGVQGDDFLCFGGAGGQLTAIDDGNTGIAPLEFDWNTGADTTTISISANLIKNTTDTYAVTITGSNGCSSSDSLAVTTLVNVDSIDVDNTPVSACGLSDGALHLTPQIGQAPFNYFWDTGSATNISGTFTRDNLAQGAYDFTITDSSPQGCPTTLKNAVVDGPGAILTNENITPVSCNGEADGCIEINVVGISPNILWSTGDTTEMVCGLSAGEYTVTVTDNGCQLELEYDMPEPNKMVVNPTIEDATCFGGNDGSISLNVFNGTPLYQFAWQHGPTTGTVTNLLAGSYAVTVTDSRNCEVVIPNITVGEPTAISFQIDELTQPTCNGLADGQIMVTPSGGTAPYDVDWSNGGMGTTINSLAAGTYGVSIDDANGCIMTDLVALLEPLPISVQFDGQEIPVCNGVDDGSIYITPSGGNGGYTFLWNNGMTAEDLIDTLPPGDYWVTVTDSRGCTGVSDTATLEETPFLELSIVASNPTCFGVDDGAILAGVSSGGLAPFEFNWSTDDSGTFISGLAPGDYIVTVSDSDGCRFDTTITLVTEQVLDVDWEIFEPTCHDTANGMIVLNVAGGLQPYDILWSDDWEEPTFPGLPAGNYAATVTDANECKYFTPLIKLTEPDPLVIDVVTVEGVSCSGDSDGSIDVNIFGGTPNIDIAWSNGAAMTSNSGLAPGVYTVSATDSKGCVTVSPPIEITSPEPLELQADDFISDCQAPIPDSTCVQVQGGVAPYQFAWSNGDMDACLGNVPTGDYGVTVSDAAGCTAEMMSVKVNENVTLISISHMPMGQDSICAGAASGEIQVMVEGGVFPYQFIWNNGVTGTSSDTLLQLNGLSGGSYQVTITDESGCTKISDFISIVEADSVETLLPGSNLMHVNCYDGSDGAIDLQVSGGFPPYHFYWEDALGEAVDSTEDLENLPAGEYFVTVTDQYSCSDEASANIFQPLAELGLDPQEPEHLDESCFGFEDGMIFLDPTGGTGPYSYEWSTGATSQNLDGLAPGEYFVTITDANNCDYFSNAIEISGPQSPLILDFSNVVDVTCFDGLDGQIDVDFVGGTPPYTYQWTPPSNAEDLFGIPAGNYDLLVFDSNLCTATAFFEVAQPAELTLAATVTHASPGMADGIIVPNAVGGMEPYTFELATGQMGDTLTNLAPDAYELYVTDANGCVTSIWVDIFDGLVQVIDNQSIESLLIYPNPTDGLVQFQLTATESIDLELVVFDMIGKEIFTRKLNGTNQIEYTFDFSDLAPGVYSIVGKTEQGLVLAERVVVY